MDGNDALAVYAVTKHVADRIRETGRLAFIEALTYRIGAHSTSDDPTRYRDESVTDEWRKRDPIARLRGYLDKKGWWSDAEEQALVDDTTAKLKAEIVRAEAADKPALSSLFSDVYATPTPHLVEQEEELVKWLS